ncbi:M23 family metallopeptidase [Microbacterium sp. cx-59]|uniref:M23 family metallopeptidase n=1 Tax=Microbacterium sp. cx-59 TaxID=2891207 RepID=UPI001E5DEE62|nr:M23 family metallopeptidase [Microbacterium sp. cx-59]MCC4909097.1 M23 family metallopeptidase [Microbacterium sp. cx-59]
MTPSKTHDLSRRTLLAAIGVGVGVAVVGFEGVAPAVAAGEPVWGHPVLYRGVVSTIFNPGQSVTKNERSHDGIDFNNAFRGSKGGETIYAIADGRVSFSGVSGGYGYLVRVEHSGGWSSWYGHTPNGATVSVGTQVTRGTAISIIGNTGRSFGPHLHLEIHSPNGRVDPAVRVMGAPLPGQPVPPPSQESDMYDTAAQQALFRKIENDTRPIRLYTWGTGVIAVGPGGKEWIVPSQAYIDLLVFLRLCGPESVPITTEQKNFLTMISGLLNPDPDVNAQAGGVLDLAPAEAERLARGLPASA